MLFTTDADANRIGSFMNVSFATDDVEETYRELKARGVEFDSPPTKESWGVFTIFKDL